MCGGGGWGEVSAPSRGNRKFKRHRGEREAMKGPRALGELKLVQYGRRQKKDAGELGGVRWEKACGSC